MKVQSVTAAAGTKRRKALVFFDQDLTIRHFILGGVFRELEAVYDVVYVFHADAASGKKNIHSDLSALPVLKKVEINLPRKRGGLWDILCVASMLRYTRHLPNYMPMFRLYKTIYSKRLLSALSIVSRPILFEIFRALLKLRQGPPKEVLALIEKEKPDILLHPSVLLGFLIDDLSLAAKAAGLPLVCLMNSWDNPSQKRIASQAPTKLVVWGEQGRRHAIDYFGMPGDDVVIGGAAQFEIYRNGAGRSRSDLCAEFGVPSDRPVLLYAGCSKGVVESSHLKLIDDAIESGQIQRCHVIYRPHPWKSRLMPGESDMRTLGLKNVTIDPYMASYYDALVRHPVSGFQLADYSVTVRLLNFVDAMVSPLSTMMLEAAMCGKPVLCLTTNDDFFHPEITMRDMRHLVHFSEFFNTPGIRECWEVSRLADECRMLIADALNPEIVANLKRHAEFFVSFGDETYGAKLLKLADSLCNREHVGQRKASHASA